MFRYETFKIFYLFRDGDTLAVRTICVSHTQMEVRWKCWSKADHECYLSQEDSTSVVAYHGDNNKLLDKVKLTSGSFQNVELIFFYSRESKTAFAYHTRGNMQFGFRRVCEILNKRDLQSSWVLFRMNLTWITKLWWLVKFVQLIFKALALVR